MMPGYSVEHTLILSGAKSLVERCLYYMTKIKNPDVNFEEERIRILADHALISNSVDSLDTKSRHDESVMFKLHNENEQLQKEKEQPEKQIHHKNKRSVSDFAKLLHAYKATH